VRFCSFGQGFGFPITMNGQLRTGAVEADPALKPVLKQLHIALVYTMLLIIVVHLLAALKHHFIDRDGVLKRMLP